MCDGICLVESVFDFEWVVCELYNENEVYVVLVFIGLGVLYWDFEVCGLVFGLMCGMICEDFIKVIL